MPQNGIQGRVKTSRRCNKQGKHIRLIHGKNNHEKQP